MQKMSYANLEGGRDGFPAIFRMRPGGSADGDG